LKKKPSPFVWVIAGVVLVLAYSAFYRKGKDSYVPADPVRPAESAAIIPSPASTAKIPEWVPIYPGTTPEEITERTAGVEKYLTFKLHPKNGNCRQFLDYYRTVLNERGFHVYADTVSEADKDVCSSVLRSDGPGRQRSINFNSGNGARDGKLVWNISVEVIERQKSGPNVNSVNSLPSWVPIYPGTIPEFINGRSSRREKNIDYSFRSTDDQTKVLKWFDEKLNAAGFRVTSDFVVAAGGFVHSHTADQKRMFNVEAARPGSAPMFHVRLRDTE